MSINPKAILDSTVNASRSALSKAGSVAKDLSEKSVLKVELVQLQRRLAKVRESLGAAVAEHFLVSNTLDKGDNRVSGLLIEIEHLHRDIESRQAQLAG